MMYMATDISVAFILRTFPVVFRGKIDNFAYEIVVFAHTIDARACVFNIIIVPLCAILFFFINH